MNVEGGCKEAIINNSPVDSIKEESIQNNGHEASVSPGHSSPEPHCPICLEKLENKSFTDSCLHQFCFKCLLEWSKVKAECPLCKQSFKSIIHNVRSIEDYEQYYLTTTSGRGSVYVSPQIFAQLDTPTNYRDRLRTSAVTSYLDYFVHLEEALSHRVIPPGSSISGGLLWQRRRQRGTSEFRRNIYQQGLWVQRTSDVTGRVRECSPEFYRENPAQVHRLVPWLNRELNVLLHENSPHIQHVMSRILELITQVPIRSPQFAASIGPYIGRHSEHFIHEFHSFAISPCDLMGYDRHSSYVGRSEIGDLEEISRDSDSDVQVLEEGTRAPSPLIQLVDTDSDDCVVLDLPIRSAPEVITLDSDDDDVVQISIQTYQPSQSTSDQPSQSTSSQPKPSTLRRPPRLKRNWLTVNKVQMPSTSSTSENINGCKISINIEHSTRSVSPSISEDSSTSWSPRRKPTKVKRKKEKSQKKRSSKGKSSQLKTKLRVVNESESDSSSSFAPRRHRAPVALVSSSSSEYSDSNGKYNPEKPSTSVVRGRKRLVSSSTSSDSNDVRNAATDKFVASDSSTSSDEAEYKPRLRSVVVKSSVRTNPRTVSPSFHFSNSRSESYDSAYSYNYSDVPSSSRSKSDSYKSSYSHHRHPSTSSSVERLPSKKCKHSKKRTKREK